VAEFRRWQNFGGFGEQITAVELLAQATEGMITETESEGMITEKGRESGHPRVEVACVAFSHGVSFLGVHDVPEVDEML